MKKTTNKRSENAKAVAREVSETIGNQKKVNFGKIIGKRYSTSTSKTPQRVTETKSYQEEMKPVLDQLITERQRALDGLKLKISKAKYRDLNDAIDKLTKNIQLLSGGATERVVEVTEDRYGNIIKRAATRFESGGSK